MKKAIVIKSFCNTNEKIEVLNRCIIKIKEKINYPIILHAGYNVPLDIINSVDYYIGYNNSSLTLTDNYRWKKINGFNGEFRSYIPDYGFAEAIQLKICTSFLDDFNFELAHIINYDIDLDQLICGNFLEEHEKLIKEGNECVYHLVKEKYAGLLLYTICVKPFKNKVSGYIDKDLWNYIIQNAGGTMSENIFYWLFNQTKSKSYINNFLFNDLIKSKWPEEIEDNHKSKDIIKESGIYSTKRGDFILIVESFLPLEGDILVDEISIKTNNSHINIITLQTCPKSVKYLPYNTQEEIEIIDENKIKTMNKKLIYYDPE